MKIQPPILSRDLRRLLLKEYIHHDSFGPLLAASKQFWTALSEEERYRLRRCYVVRQVITRIAIGRIQYAFSEVWNRAMEHHGLLIDMDSMEDIKLGLQGQVGPYQSKSDRLRTCMKNWKHYELWNRLKHNCKWANDGPIEYAVNENTAWSAERETVRLFSASRIDNIQGDTQDPYTSGAPNTCDWGPCLDCDYDWRGFCRDVDHLLRYCAYLTKCGYIKHQLTMTCPACGDRVNRWDAPRHVPLCWASRISCTGCGLVCTRRVWHQTRHDLQPCVAGVDQECASCLDSSTTLSSLQWNLQAFEDHVTRCAAGTFGASCDHSGSHASGVRRACAFCMCEINNVFELSKHEDRCGRYRQTCQSCKGTFQRRDGHNHLQCAAELDVQSSVNDSDSSHPVDEDALGRRIKMRRGHVKIVQDGQDPIFY